jgi:5-methylcytosine-specific restriction protein A
VLILARDPICRICKVEASTVADHIVPLRRGGDWGLENGQGLCASCHGKKTAKEDGRWG